MDLDRSALCGVPLGSPIERLGFLGPADETRRRGDSMDFYGLSYAKLGLAVYVENGRFEEFTVMVDPPPGAVYRGQWTWRGSPVPITAETSPEDLRQILGDPWAEAIDSLNVVWFYERPESEWQFRWNGDDKLNSVEINTMRELADVESRKYYGVTRPWPTEFAERRD